MQSVWVWSRALMAAFVINLTGMAFFSAWAQEASAGYAYSVDKAHSSIGFTVSHLVVSKTTGNFNDYDGQIQFNPDDLANAKFDFTVKVAGIDTKNEGRDKHLKGADFFDAEKYPDIVFKTSKVELQSGNDYLVTGELTMKGVTKELQLPVKIAGPVPNPMGGGQVLGIESHFVINRQDYGVSWNKTMDNGGVVVGNEVQIAVMIEAHK